MDKQPIRRRRAARTVAVGVAVAALVGILGAGQALAATPSPDERMLERQGRIDRQAAAGQADEQANAKERSQQKATEVPRRWIRPEPNMDPRPPLDPDEQLAPAPVPAAPAGDRTVLIVTMVVAALLLAVGAATTWRIRHRTI